MLCKFEACHKLIWLIYVLHYIFVLSGKQYFHHLHQFSFFVDGLYTYQDINLNYPNYVQQINSKFTLERYSI